MSLSEGQRAFLRLLPLGLEPTMARKCQCIHTERRSPISLDLGQWQQSAIRAGVDPMISSFSKSLTEEFEHVSTREQEIGFNPPFII